MDKRERHLTVVQAIEAEPAQPVAPTGLENLDEAELRLYSVARADFEHVAREKLNLYEYEGTRTYRALLRYIKSYSPNKEEKGGLSITVGGETLLSFVWLKQLVTPNPERPDDPLLVLDIPGIRVNDRQIVQEVVRNREAQIEAASQPSDSAA